MRLGTVLETARRSRGMTQAQLAEAINATQPTIQRYENDLREPDEETLHALADALGVTPSFLLHASRPESALAVHAHMRRRKTAPPTVWRRLEAQLNMTRWHMGKLFEEVSVQATLSVPQFDPDLTSPSEAAQLVRTQWRLPIGPVRNLVSWLESAGIVVIEWDFESAKIDGLSQWAGDHPVIMINGASPTDRKRLTLAHELGHLVLHMHTAGDDIEDQANEFAAEFLMPIGIIRSDLKGLKTGKLIDLKRFWGVSMAAIVERAHRLGMMLPEERTRFYKAMSARGWRTREPASDEIAPEVPQLAQQISGALRDGGIGADDVATILGFATPEDNFIMPSHQPRLRAV